VSVTKSKNSSSRAVDVLLQSPNEQEQNVQKSEVINIDNSNNESNEAHEQNHDHIASEQELSQESPLPSPVDNNDGPDISPSPQAEDSALIDVKQDSSTSESPSTAADDSKGDDNDNSVDPLPVSPEEEEKKDREDDSKATNSDEKDNDDGISVSNVKINQSKDMSEQNVDLIGSRENPSQESPPLLPVNSNDTTAMTSSSSPPTQNSEPMPTQTTSPTTSRMVEYMFSNSSKAALFANSSMIGRSPNGQKQNEQKSEDVINPDNNGVDTINESDEGHDESLNLTTSEQKLSQESPLPSPIDNHDSPDISPSPQEEDSALMDVKQDSSVSESPSTAADSKGDGSANSVDPLPVSPQEPEEQDREEEEQGENESKATNSDEKDNDDGISVSNDKISQSKDMSEQNADLIGSKKNPSQESPVNSNATTTISSLSSPPAQDTEPIPPHTDSTDYILPRKVEYMAYSPNGQEQIEQEYEVINLDNNDVDKINESEEGHGKSLNLTTSEQEPSQEFSIPLPVDNHDGPDISQSRQAEASGSTDMKQDSSSSESHSPSTAADDSRRDDNDNSLVLLASPPISQKVEEEEYKEIKLDDSKEDGNANSVDPLPVSPQEPEELEGKSNVANLNHVSNGSNDTQDHDLFLSASMKTPSQKSPVNIGDNTFTASSLSGDTFQANPALSTYGKKFGLQRENSDLSASGKKFGLQRKNSDLSASGKRFGRQRLDSDLSASGKRFGRQRLDSDLSESRKGLGLIGRLKKRISDRNL